MERSTQDSKNISKIVLRVMDLLVQRIFPTIMKGNNDASPVPRSIVLVVDILWSNAVGEKHPPLRRHARRGFGLPRRGPPPAPARDLVSRFLHA
jgi:hypothetical protein